jgi:serine/threonine-protein kinase
MSTANTLTSGLDCASPESIMEPTNRTPAGDQYSLGCVLYYCLTGRVPFPEGSAVEKMMAHQTKDPMPISELAPDVPAGLIAVVERLMAKTPEGRYNGCDELVETLEPFLGDPNQIPGGMPGMNSGARPGLGGHSSGGRPGLPPRSNPGQKVTLPSRAVAQNSPVAPNVRTPNPQPTPARGQTNIPSRASFQLPALSDATDTGATAKAATTETPRAALPKLPTRGTTGSKSAPAATSAKGKSPAPQLELVDEPEDTPAWAHEGGDEKKGGFGAIGIIVASLLIMVAVYFGATLLMK